LDHKLSTKVVSILLISSICLLGYVSMSTFGQPSSIPGKVSIDSRVQFKQNDNVSYWFGSDSYVDRLEIAPTYFEINTLTMTTSVSTGNVNVTLYDFDAGDGYLRWRADQDVATASVSFRLDGLRANILYDWFIDGNVVAHTVCDGVGGAQYTYSGPWSSHEFVVQKSDGPSVNIQASFEYTIDGNTVTFKDNSYGPITIWIWNFGDGAGSTKESPVHRYVSSGAYTVVLTVYDSASHSSSASVSIKIVLGPDNPIERDKEGWNIYLSEGVVVSIPAIGLLIVGMLLFTIGSYVPTRVVTPKGLKIIAALMMLAAAYFFIFIDNSWM